MRLYIAQRMLPIAHNSEHKKNCQNYNLRRIPRKFGLAPARIAIFPPMFRHCLLPFLPEVTEVLLCILWCHSPEAIRGQAGVSGFGSARRSAGLWFGEKR